MLNLTERCGKTITIGGAHEAFAGTAIEGEGEAIVFELAHIQSTQRMEIRKRYTKNKRGVEDFDDVGFVKALLDKLLVGWKGIQIEGKESECNRAAKDFIVDNYFDLANRIIEASRIESEKIESARRDELKN